MNPLPTFLCALAAAALGLSSLHAASLPNIVLFVSDDLGWGSTSPYGADPKLIRTPNVTKLSQTGVTFDNASTTASVCSPTRYAMLTGRYAWRTHLKSGVVNSFDPLLIEPSTPTLGGFLKERGYYTAYIGKWRGDKHTIYEGGFRVPLIVSFPKQLAAGVRSAAYVTTANFFATIAEMHGIKDLPENTAPDSFSFAHVLRDPKAPSKRPHTVLSDVKGRQALRFGKWKMIDAKVPNSKDLDIELYDIEADPSETRNVAKKNPEIIEQGQKLLQAIRDTDSSRKIRGL